LDDGLEVLREQRPDERREDRRVEHRELVLEVNDVYGRPLVDVTALAQLHSIVQIAGGKSVHLMLRQGNLASGVAVALERVKCRLRPPLKLRTAERGNGKRKLRMQ
jgi:hypothetical protein